MFKYLPIFYISLVASAFAGVGSDWSAAMTVAETNGLAEKMREMKTKIYILVYFAAMFCVAGASGMDSTNRWSDASNTNVVRGRCGYYIPYGFSSDGVITTGTAHQAVAADNFNALYERDKAAMIENSTGAAQSPGSGYIAWWGRANYVNLRTNKIYVTNQLLQCYADPDNLSGGNYNTFFGAHNPSSVVYTASDLCTAGGVPTNFFDYTPYRNLDKSIYGNDGFRAVVAKLKVNEYRSYSDPTAGAGYKGLGGATNQVIYRGISTNSWAEAKSNVALLSEHSSDNRQPYNTTSGTYHSGSNSWVAVQAFCWQMAPAQPVSTNWGAAFQLYAEPNGVPETFDAAGSGLIDGQYALIAGGVYTNGTTDYYFRIGIDDVADIAGWCGDPEPEADDYTLRGWDLEDQTLEFGVKYWWIYDFSGTNGFKWP